MVRLAFERLTLDTIPFPVLLIDKNYQVVFMNKHAKELYTQSGQTCYQLSHSFSELCQGDTIDSMIQRADSALYSAKRKGKNRVEVAEAVLKILIGTPLQPLKGLTYSSPYPTPLPPAQASEEKGPLAGPFRG